MGNLKKLLFGVASLPDFPLHIQPQTEHEAVSTPEAEPKCYSKQNINKASEKKSQNTKATPTKQNRTLKPRTMKKKFGKRSVAALLKVVDSNWNDIPEKKRMEFISSTFERVEHSGSDEDTDRPAVLKNIGILVPFCLKPADSYRPGKLVRWRLPNSSKISYGGSQQKKIKTSAKQKKKHNFAQKIILTPLQKKTIRENYAKIKAYLAENAEN